MENHRSSQRQYRVPDAAALAWLVFALFTLPLFIRSGLDHLPVAWIKPQLFSQAMSRATDRGQLERLHLSFNWAGEFHQGMAAVARQGKYGFIDTTGAIQVPLQFECAGTYSENRAPVQQGGKWGYTDAKGKTVIPAIFTWAGTFQEGRAAVADSAGYAFIDSNGTFIPDSGAVRFNEVRHFSEGWAAFKIGDGEDGAWGFMNKAGTQNIPNHFLHIIGDFSQGLAAVCVGIEASYRVGYIDSSGGFAIDTLFDAGESFSEGLAAVGIGQRNRQGFQGLWGYVDVTGKLLIPQRYRWAGPFLQGRALVRTIKDGWMKIDRQGRILQQFPKHMQILPHLSSRLIGFRFAKRIGFLNETGSQVFAPHFLAAGAFHHGLAPVKPDNGSGLWNFIDEHGAYLDENPRRP